MEEEKVNNKIVEDQRQTEHDFKFNFINMPWDDRSKKSKVAIISLLVAIFVATMAIIVHNLYMHYMKTSSGRRGIDDEIKCQLVKLDQYKFVARIHSVKTQELLCVGAVISHTSVLANGICVKSGPVRLRLGSNLNPLCKKGFTVDSIEPIQHDGTISKYLVLIITADSMSNCGQVINIGSQLDKASPGYIIGRPLSSGKMLSRQPAKIIDIDIKSPGVRLTLQKTICVSDLAKCPVKAGDLLIQNGFVYGLASTSTHITEPSKVACFADLQIISSELKI
ncbi:unnamed protein product [Diatraea saccharalis]|uniref:Peptidase S1 domain-containing protein n=1 Tax=Diatraea saccharalis TaxID=40085 RepID=A0A9N9N4G2_9NEOP|nr:unnamed protein product [Diatraea saccharalis]